MDTTKLQAFCTVAELRNFSEAAKRLNYTQPAISAQIRELENELKVLLFKKVGKKVELSDAGKALLPSAETLLRNFQECRLVLPGSSEKDNHILKIGASSLPGVHLLPGLLEKAHRFFPDLGFSLGINNNYQIERMLFARQIEVGFVGRKRAHSAKGALSEHLLMKDQLVAVFPPGHPLAERTEISIGELAGLPMILPPRNILTRRQVEERFHQLGLVFELALEVSNTEAIKQLVEHNMGITILCSSAVRKEAEAGWLRSVPVSGLELSRCFYLLILNDAKHLPVAEKFINFVLNQFI